MEEEVSRQSDKYQGPEERSVLGVFRKTSEETHMTDTEGAREVMRGWVMPVWPSAGLWLLVWGAV